LATAVRRALEAKRVEKDRLVQYTVEKQRLVSALMPLDVEWAGAHALAVEDYVTERDPEAAKNLCAALNPEFMVAEAVSRCKKPLLLYSEKRSERESEQKDRAERQDRKSQNRTKNPKQNIPDGSY
jgi:hypothetical protein